MLTVKIWAVCICCIGGNGGNGCDLFEFAMIIHQVLSSAERNSPGCMLRRMLLPLRTASALTEYGSTSISAFIHGKFSIQCRGTCWIAKAPIFFGVITPVTQKKAICRGYIYHWFPLCFFLGGLAFRLKTFETTKVVEVRRIGVWRFSERLDWVHLQPLELNSL